MCAYVAVPHLNYGHLLLLLLGAGIHVLKEQSAAANLRELELFHAMAKKGQVRSTHCMSATVRMLWIHISQHPTLDWHSNGGGSAEDRARRLAPPPTHPGPLQQALQNRATTKSCSL